MAKSPRSGLHLAAILLIAAASGRCSNGHDHGSGGHAGVGGASGGEAGGFEAGQAGVAEGGAPADSGNGGAPGGESGANGETSAGGSGGTTNGAGGTGGTTNGAGGSGGTTNGAGGTTNGAGGGGGATVGAGGGGGETSSGGVGDQAGQAGESGQGGEAGGGDQAAVGGGSAIGGTSSVGGTSAIGGTSSDGGTLSDAGTSSVGGSVGSGGTSGGTETSSGGAGANGGVGGTETSSGGAGANGGVGGSETSSGGASANGGVGGNSGASGGGVDTNGGDSSAGGGAETNGGVGGGGAGQGAGGTSSAGAAATSGGGFGGGGAAAGQAGNGTGGAPAACTGVPNPSCACLKVALGGDDAAAIATAGAVPFGNVQAALDFAASHPNAARAVCVAAGSFAGPADSDLTMQNGVSVYGGYDTSTWERIPGTVTTLLPGTALGVVFGAAVSSVTTLDGFSIDRFNAETSGAVTIDGAAAAVLVNVSIAASDDASPGHPYGPDHSYGVSVLDGGHATISDSTLAIRNSGGEPGNAARETMVVRVIGASVFLDGSDSHANTIHADGWGDLYGVWLEDARGSLVAGNVIEVQGDDDSDPVQPLVVGVHVEGDADGTAIQANDVSVAGGRRGATGVELEQCAETEPMIVANGITAAAAPEDSVTGGWLALGIASADGCRTLIQNNDVQAASSVLADAVGVQGGAGTTLLDNDVSTTSDLSSALGTASSNVGVACSGCAEVSDNRITGLSQITHYLDREYTSIGLFVSGDATLVDGNRIAGGLSSGLGRSLGVSARGAVRIQNNFIEAGGGYTNDGNDGGPVSGTGWTGGIDVDGAVDLNSNSIDGGTTIFSGCTSGGITIVSGGAIIRDNIIAPGTCQTGANLEELSAAHPSVVENNDLVASAYGTVRYKYQGGSDPQSAAEVNALATVTASGNFTAVCPEPLTAGSACIDAGTSAGAPDHDFDGRPRNSASPDVGPVEWGDLPGGTGGAGGTGGTTGGSGGTTGGSGGTTGGSGGTTGGSGGTTGGTGGTGGTAGGSGGTASGAGGTGGAQDVCTGITCSGHGTCVSSSGTPSCTCDSGYAPSLSDGTVCVDVDECAVNHGGCDPLSACNNAPGTFSCGACPTGYTGDGVTGCIAKACSGEPGPDCPCIKVAPEGDDTAATASYGRLPFATTLAATAFRSTHPEVASAVCVAAGPTCGMTATFSGGYVSAGGLKIYGRYESTAWTRCPDSETKLDTSVFLDEPEDANSWFDGFTILGRADIDTPGVRLSHVKIIAPVDAGTGIYVGDGEPSIDASEIDVATTVSGFAFGITGGAFSLTNSVVHVESPNAQAVGVNASDGGPPLVGDTITVVAGGVGVGVKSLEGIDVENSTIEVTGGGETSGYWSPCGTLSNLVINATGNYVVRGVLAGSSNPCATPPELVGSTVRAIGTEGAVAAQAVSFGGLTQTLAVTDSVLSAEGSGLEEATALDCQFAGGCTVTGSRLSALPTPSTGTQGRGVIGATLTLERNVIDAGCATDGSGVEITGTGSIENNVIRAHYCPVSGGSYGIIANGATNGAVQVRQNTISGDNGARAAVLLRGGGGVFTENILISGTYHVAEASDYTGTSGVGSPGSPFLRNDFAPMAEDVPVYLLHGNLELGSIADIERWLGPSGNFTADPQFRAYPWDLHIEGGPCVDRGLPYGAPALDIDGETRTSLPDVGADEALVEHQCGGGDCAGIGMCFQRGASEECVCAPGSAHPNGDMLDCERHCSLDNGGCDALTTCSGDGSGIICGACPSGYSGSGASGCLDIDECAAGNGGCDALAKCTNTPGGRTCGPCPTGYTGSGDTKCEDVDECASAHGGCDPLVTCTNTPGGRTCGACPSGYVGTGETSCSLPCDVNNGGCDPLVTCSVVDGAVSCGACPSGYSGDGSSGCIDTAPFVQLAVATEHACGIRSSGNLECWGVDNTFYGPKPIYGQPFTQVSCAQGHTCAVRGDGSVTCWGWNMSAPNRVGPFKAVATGFSQACGLKLDGTLECWNYSGTTPTAPPSGTFTAITGGDYHTCALRSGVNTVACWGSNQWGQSSPPANEEFSSISAGTTATCGLHPDGTAECWGGIEVPGWDDPPPSGPFTALSIGYYNGCGQDASQHLTCWGFSNPLLSNQPSGAVKAFALGMRDGCAVLPDDSLTCWGATADLDDVAPPR